VTLTFVSAGLLALGLSRLDDLEVEAADRAARSGKVLRNRSGPLRS